VLFSTCAKYNFGYPYPVATSNAYQCAGKCLMTAGSKLRSTAGENFRKRTSSQW